MRTNGKGGNSGNLYNHVRFSVKLTPGSTSISESPVNYPNIPVYEFSRRTLNSLESTIDRVFGLRSAHGKSQDLRGGSVAGPLAADESVSARGLCLIQSHITGDKGLVPRLAMINIDHASACGHVDGKMIEHHLRV